MPRDNILFCGGLIIVLKVLLLSFMVTVMIREFGHFEKKDFPVSLCKQNYCKNDFVSY